MKLTDKLKNKIENAKTAMSKNQEKNIPTETRIELADGDLEAVSGGVSIISDDAELVL